MKRRRYPPKRRKGGNGFNFTAVARVMRPDLFPEPAKAPDSPQEPQLSLFTPDSQGKSSTSP